MSKVFQDRTPTPERLKELGVANWPTWSKEVSVFPFEFNARESAYILEGECIITPDDGSEPIHFGKGDFLIFPEGLSCTWEVKKPLKKHYKHG